MTNAPLLAFSATQRRLHVTPVIVAELYAWAYRAVAPDARCAQIRQFLADVRVIQFDLLSAQQFGKLRVELRRTGIGTAPMDLLIAATAITHDLTLITNNARDFALIPGLRTADWSDK